MAEIKVDKSTPTPWPWLLALAAVLLLGWLVFGRSDDSEVAGVPTSPKTGTDTVALPPAPPPAVAPPAVEEFARNCGREVAGTGEIGMQHPYATACIRRMTAALDVMIPQDTLERAAFEPQLQDYGSKAREIERSDEQSLEHANRVRDVFTSATALLTQMYQARYASVPELEEQIAAVKEAAEALRLETLVSQQQPETSRFFRRVGDVLRMMATQPVAPVTQPGEAGTEPADPHR